jgi:hypothetical protein
VVSRVNQVEKPCRRTCGDRLDFASDKPTQLALMATPTFQGGSRLPLTPPESLRNPFL